MVLHNYQKEEDQQRTDDMEKDGITVLRFSNEEVLEDMRSVLEKIKKFL